MSEKMKMVIKAQPCLTEAFLRKPLSCFTKISVQSGEMANNIYKGKITIFLT